MQNLDALAEEFSNAIWKRNDRLELTEMLEQLLADKGLPVESPGVVDKFDTLKKRVAERLARRIKEADASGLKPRYTFADFDSDYLLPLTNISEDEIQREVTRALSDLSWRAFEKLCAAVLTFEVVQAATASGSKEEGIDIFGLVKLRDLSSSAFWHDVTVRIAGQAKKGKITEPMVRLFSRDLESLRKSRGRGYSQSPLWFQNSLAPILGMMFTASIVARPAKAWAESNGIIVKNGHQIVETLIRRKENVPGFNYQQDQLIFDKAGFVQHFEQQL